MSNLPPETKALQRQVYAGLIAFVVGFFVTLAALEWLMVRLVDPDTRRWQILHFSISAIIISGVGGLALAAGTACALSWFHYWRGVHRCRFCGRPLKGVGVLCDCPQAQAMKK